MRTFQEYLLALAAARTLAAPPATADVSGDVPIIDPTDIHHPVVGRSGNGSIVQERAGTAFPTPASSSKAAAMFQDLTGCEQYADDDDCRAGAREPRPIPGRQAYA